MAGFAVTVPRVSNSLRSQLILSNLNQTAVELMRLQNQISSGRRILTPSDDPFDATVAGQLQGFLEQKSRFEQNILNAEGVLSTADSALGHAGDIINGAHSIGLAEIGAIATGETRRSAAVVINEMLLDLVNLANSKFSGRYIFAGRETLSAPFENLPEGVCFRGDTGSVEVSIDYSASSSTSVDAAAAFGAVSSEVRGRTDLDPILTLDTLLSDLNGGAGVRGGVITINDGTTVSTIDLSGARTVGDVITAINAGTPPTTVASIPAVGNALQINGGAGANYSIDNTLGGWTATDLGIHLPTPSGPFIIGQDIDPLLTPLTPLTAVGGADWASGLVITVGPDTETIDFTGCTRIQDVLNKINFAGLNVEARINEAGSGIDIVNRLSGAEMFIGENGGTTATDLGIRSMHGGSRLLELGGGLGVNTVSGDDVTITLKDGTVFSVDLSSAVSVQDVVDAINNAAGNPGTLVAAMAVVGNGIELTDGSGGGGDLTVTRANNSNAGEELGILGSTTGTVLTGEDVNPICADGVFTHLIKLKEALMADDAAGISFYTGKLEEDLPDVLETRGSIGARQQRMESVKERISSEIVELQSMLSDRIDLDYATSVVRFSTLQASFEAGLQTAGSLLQMSLIDFLR